MGWFVREFFTASPVLALPVLALLVFVAVWTVMAVRTLRMPKQDVDARARLAMEGEQDG